MIAILASQVLIPLRGMHPRFARTVDCFAIDRLYVWIIPHLLRKGAFSVVNCILDVANGNFGGPATFSVISADFVAPRQKHASWIGIESNRKGAPKDTLANAFLVFFPLNHQPDA